MKIFIQLLIFCHSIVVLGNDLNTNTWSTFKSDYGYEVKYPECWEVRNDSPDDGELKLIRSINITAGKSCKIKNHDKNFVHNFGFNALGEINPEFAKKEIINKSEHSKIKLKNREWLAFEKVAVKGNGVATVYVEEYNKTSKSIRWVVDLYCPTHKYYIIAGGTENPSREILQKFEKSDLAMPEPEKSIFESIRCVKPKAK